MANPIQQGLKRITPGRFPPIIPMPQWLIQYNKDWNAVAVAVSAAVTVPQWLIQYNKDWNREENHAVAAWKGPQWLIQYNKDWN